MKVKVNGYNHVKSKKDGSPYTIVHGTSDLSFSSNSGAGFQNIQIFLQGFKNFEIGAEYLADTEEFMQNGQLCSRIVDLIN